MIITALQFYDKEGIEGYKFFLPVDAIGTKNIGDVLTISSYYFPEEGLVNDFKKFGFDFGKHPPLFPSMATASFQN